MLHRLLEHGCVFSRVIIIVQWPQNIFPSCNINAQQIINDILVNIICLKQNLHVLCIKCSILLVNKNSEKSVTNIIACSSLHLQALRRATRCAIVSLVFEIHNKNCNHSTNLTIALSIIYILDYISNIFLICLLTCPLQL